MRIKTRQPRKKRSKMIFKKKEEDQDEDCQSISIAEVVSHNQNKRAAKAYQLQRRYQIEK
jgi:hypothetical protein